MPSRHNRQRTDVCLRGTIGSRIDATGMAPERQQRRQLTSERGYAMAGMLVAIAIMGITMSMLTPSWRAYIQREKEAELIFRGEQYMRAIELYQRQFPGAYPTGVEILVEQRFLRRAYLDPMTGDNFQLLDPTSVTAAVGEVREVIPGVSIQEPGVTRVQQGPVNPRSERAPMTEAARGLGGGDGIIGVATTATGNSMALYNGRNKYEDWLFVYMPQVTTPGQATAGALPSPPQSNAVIGGPFDGVWNPSGGFGGRGRPGGAGSQGGLGDRPGGTPTGGSRGTEPGGTVPPN